MNLYQFINTVKQIVLANKDVNTFNDGDVYEIMNSGQHTYPATVLTINNITTNEQTHYQTINCVLFYIDRLTDDYSNKTMIMSQGFNVLKQIKDKIVESLPWTFETANYTPYTEKFGDLCAGVYLECTIVLEDDVICSDTSFTMKQLEVTSNGLYSTIGYDTVLVSVNEPVLHYIEINENGEYTPQEGVDGFSLVVVNVPDPELEELSVTANGTYTPNKYGYSRVDVNVPEQKPEQTKSVTITENGTTSVLPDEGSVLNKVDVTVNVSGGGGTAVFHGSNPQFKGIEGDFPNAEFPDITSCDSMFFNCESLTSVPLFDTSNVTRMSNMFTDCYKLTAIPKFDTSNVTNMYAMFQWCSSLTSVPLFDTSNVTYMSTMFTDCSKLTTVPLFDTSKVTDMNFMFAGCSALTTVPLFVTSNVTDMNHMFNFCSSLTSVPLFDTSNVTDMNWMFSGCSSLTSVPLFDTSKVTNMNEMFSRCSKLTSVPLFDTSNVTDMSFMFSGCYKLTSVPLFDTSNVTNMQEMFRSCNILVTVPQFDTSNVTNMSSMFTSCKKLTTVPQLNASNVTDISDMFNGCNLLKNFGGLLNIGQAYTTTFTYNFQNCKNLSKESIQNIINGLYDMTAKGFSPTLKFNSAVYSKLTDEQKTQITNKNWTVAL